MKNGLTQTPNRKRGHYIGLVLLTIVMGLLSRTSVIPAFVYPYLGDAFYALMCFWLIALFFPKSTSFKVALLSISFCYAIELSQLHQADWINTLRSFKLGKLVLGSGFLWSDFASYAAGGVLGYFLELTVFKE